jgi:hypothetical protein
VGVGLWLHDRLTGQASWLGLQLCRLANPVGLRVRSICQLTVRATLGKVVNKSKALPSMIVTALEVHCCP